MAAPKKRRHVLRWAALALLLLLLAGTAVYLLSYYHASSLAMQSCAAPAAGITVREIPGKGLAFVPEKPTAGIIFYPGGKVQAEAYAPLMERCAGRGILCVLLKMPCNLAVFAPNAAQGTAALFPQVERWYVAGHSLGGVMAARYAAKHPGELAGLALLAAYATEDLRDSGLAVLSVVGSEDGVLNQAQYEKAKANLPVQARELVVEGGNHAQFGSYGPQRGDGTASIPPQAQWDQTAAALAAWMAGEDDSTKEDTQ